jgi:hypothetical protein
MTLLPALPKLGEPLAEEDALSRIRDEIDEDLLLLADLLAVESQIEQTGMQFFVMEKKDFQAQLSSRLPEEFVNTFYQYQELPEAEWLTKTYSSWFEVMLQLSEQVGSQLLGQWARWEYSLRAALVKERRQSNQHNDDSLFKSPLMNETESSYDHSSLIEAWKDEKDPLTAEKILDQSRIEFLKSQSLGYSFSVEELVAYMLELRIHNRYARLSLDEGRKILEEVTAL